MWNKKDKDTTPEITTTLDVISATTVLRGNVEIEGDIRVDGKILGDLKVTGKLVINETAQISGNIECESVNILGKYEGTIRASNLITVSSVGYLKGDVYTNYINIEKGGYFQGCCFMEENEQ